jgi:hypothetical protein
MLNISILRDARWFCSFAFRAHLSHIDRCFVKRIEETQPVRPTSGTGQNNIENWEEARFALPSALDDTYLYS